ncbi:class I SAM-dependent methyltransferase [uncultured Croceitalea sp.]|uniref:THUMP-like domain-containing protein n=1 Tax=uncultured Croceitalea sp. TaxID=1798908 RepID=UPI00330626A8
MSVLLKKPLFEGVSQKELCEQLEAKKKCQHKLPKWFTTPLIYYPNKLHIEQTSSEVTAQYKASLIRGKSLLDITGGLGVDCFFFAKNFDRVKHCEWNENLSQITAHNYAVLDVKNIECLTENGIRYLQRSKENFDWIFIDPSRRNESRGKVFLLADCLPNVPENLELFFEHTNKIILKTSPLLDIKQGLNELRFVKEIHVIAVQNEVKEILWLLENNHTLAPSIKTVNLKKNIKEVFDFTLAHEKTASSQFDSPKTYLFEPNSAILKAGAFKLIGSTYKLQKLHEHSHLYTSSLLIDFPGRCFLIEKVINYNRKEILKLALGKANITTRNFPETVGTIRKKFKIKDGGEYYLFFTTNVENKRIVIVCKKA